MQQIMNIKEGLAVNLNPVVIYVLVTLSLLLVNILHNRFVADKQKFVEGQSTCLTLWG